MNDLKIFENTEFGKIRILEKDGKPFAVGVDVTRALGYAKPSQAVIDHCKGIRKLGIPSMNQHGATVMQETNVIPEGDIYRLITKAADQSKNLDIKEKAERFESWIFDEVLPSIHKHGAYMTPEKIEEVLLNPDTIITLATQIKHEQEQNAKLNKKIEEDKPLVLFANSVSASSDTMLIGELSKILKQNGVDTGQNRLFQWMRDNEYLIRRKGSDYNMPTQRSMEMGLFTIKETTITHSDGHISINKTVKVTGKGQIYFINKLKNVS